VLLLFGGLIYLSYLDEDAVVVRDSLWNTQRALADVVTPVLALLAGGVWVLLALWATRAGAPLRALGVPSSGAVPAGLAWLGGTVPLAASGLWSAGLPMALVLAVVGVVGAVVQLLAQREPTRATVTAAGGLPLAASVRSSVPWQLYTWCAGWAAWCTLLVIPLLFDGLEEGIRCTTVVCAVHGGSYVLAHVALALGSALAALALHRLAARVRRRPRGPAGGAWPAPRRPS
jgi:hypothetical protein